MPAASNNKLSGPKHSTGVHTNWHIYVWETLARPLDCLLKAKTTSSTPVFWAGYIMVLTIRYIIGYIMEETNIDYENVITQVIM